MARYNGGALLALIVLGIIALVVWIVTHVHVHAHH